MPNTVLIWGTVDSDINRRTTPQGKAVADFRINDGKGWQTVVCWEDLSSQIPARGEFVIVSGRLQTRSYEAQDGGKRYVTEIIASTLSTADSDEPAKSPPGSVPGADAGDLFAD